MSSMNNNSGDELRQLQTRTNEIVDKSLDSTRRMVQLCEESQDTGAKTLNMLDQQGEQLDNIEEGMNQVNEDMKKAEKNLEGMEKCCGLCVLPFGRKNNEFKEDTETWSKSGGKSEVISAQPLRSKSDENNKNITSGNHIVRITNDAREDEMEDNMQQVGNILGNLKNMAIDMGSELETQNVQIDRINAKAESNDARISSAKQRAGKLLQD